MVSTSVIGASGFIGGHLLEAYRSVCPEAVGTSFSRAKASLLPFDLRHPDLKALDLPARGVKDLLITSAKPNVSFCTQNPEAAREVNVTGMLRLLRQAVDLGLKPIFISSDYVFDGHTGGHDDDEPTNPSTEYGRQKQEVERELPRLTDNYLILRLSKIYGLQRGDGTMLDEMAAALLAGKPVRAATDQCFCPTAITDLVKAIMAIQERGLRGTLNVCAPTAYSRHAVALLMAKALGLPDSGITPVRLHSLEGMSDRPLNTSMHCSRLTRELGCPFTPLPDHATLLAKQWLS